jgi:hypothetical protein
VASVANTLRQHRADLFLGSLPGLVQAPGLAEAAWAGVAIARFTGQDAAGAGPAATLDWNSPADLAGQLADGIAPDRLADLAEAARHWHRRRNDPARFARRLGALIDATEGRLGA